MIETYPNISKEKALESINTVILYLRQFGLRNETALNNSHKAKAIEKVIGELIKGDKMKVISINESIILLNKLWKSDALSICHISTPTNISGAPDENYKTSPEQNTRKRIEVFLTNEPNYLWTFEELKETFDSIYRFTGWVMCTFKLGVCKDYPCLIVNLENYNY